MRLFRFFCTLRGLIVLVALIAVGLAIPLQTRRLHYLHQARLFRERAAELINVRRLDFYPEGAAWEVRHAKELRQQDIWRVRLREYFRSKQKQYEYAALHPWLRDPGRLHSFGMTDSTTRAFRPVPFPAGGPVAPAEPPPPPSITPDP